MLSGASYKSLLTGLLAFYGFIILFWISKRQGPEPRDFDRHTGITSEPPVTPDQAVKNRTLGVCSGTDLFSFFWNFDIDHRQ
jgi:hypothetical protein